MPGPDVPDRTDVANCALLFFLGVLAALQFGKVPPLLADVAADLSLGPIPAGAAVSMVGAAGVALGVAAGTLCERAGPTRVLAAAIVLGIAGGIGSALFTAPILFLLSRAVESVSHLGIVVAAPVLMVRASTVRDRTVVMAVWAAFFGVAMTIANLWLPSLAAMVGWRMVFAGHAVTLAVIGGAALGRMNAAWREERRHTPSRSLMVLHARTYQDRRRVALACAFMCNTILYIALLTHLIPYLADARGMTLVEAARWMSVCAAAGLIATFGVGVVMRWRVSPIHAMGVGFVLFGAAVGCAILLPISDDAARLALVAGFVGTGLVQGGVFAAVPWIGPAREDVALANGLIAQMGNLGAFLGTPLLALSLAISGSWAAIPLLAILATALGAAIAYGRVGLARASDVQRVA